MKTLLRRLVGFPPGADRSLWLVNILFQRVFRLDAGCRYNKHFTSRVLHPAGLHIEDDCPIVRRSLTVSGGCYINCADGLHIGSGTIWAPNVAIVAQDHGRLDLDEARPTKGIRIGRHCWLGIGSVILPDVVLGDHTIVAANAVVNRSFPEGRVILAGAPARVVRVLGDDESAEQAPPDLRDAQPKPA